MTTQGRVRKPRHSSGPVAVSVSAATFTTSKACGLTWTNESGQGVFPHCPGGRHPKAGHRVFGRTSRANQTVRATEQRYTVVVLKLRRWRKQSRAWRNRLDAACTEDCCATWPGSGTRGRSKRFRCFRKCWSTCDQQNVDCDAWKPLSTRQVRKPSSASSGQWGLVRSSASIISKL